MARRTGIGCLLRLDARLLDHRGPLGDLSGEQLPQLPGSRNRDTAKKNSAAHTAPMGLNCLLTDLPIAPPNTIRFPSVARGSIGAPHLRSPPSISAKERMFTSSSMEKVRSTTSRALFVPRTGSA